MRIIRILDFIKTGKFGDIEVGQTKEYVGANFPPPDDTWDDGKGISIWESGRLELHFFDEGLITIWCDWLECIADTEKFALDIWQVIHLDK